LIFVLAAGPVCAAKLGPLPPKNFALNSVPPAAIPFDIETLKNSCEVSIVHTEKLDGQ
jgi:hypothetical protein